MIVNIKVNPDDYLINNEKQKFEAFHGTVLPPGEIIEEFRLSQVPMQTKSRTGYVVSPGEHRQGVSELRAVWFSTDSEHADNYAKEGDLRNLRGVPQVYRVELSPHRTIEIDNSRDDHLVRWAASLQPDLIIFTDTYEYAVLNPTRIKIMDSVDMEGNYIFSYDPLDKGYSYYRPRPEKKLPFVDATNLPRAGAGRGGYGLRSQQK